MNFAQEAEKHLASTESSEIMKGLGYSLLALTQEMRDNKKRINTTTGRKIEEGDVMILYCRRCNEETQAHAHMFGVSFNASHIDWVCSKCGKIMILGK